LEENMETIKIPGTPTRDLATFASELRYVDIPKEAIEHAKTCVLDDLGCVLFGKNLPWCEKLYDFICEEKGRSVATCWGRGERVSATQAALYNGTAGHGFEIDDLYITSHHPGPATIPAAMATVEHVGGGSGKKFLTAVVAAYEVSTRIGTAMYTHFFRGYHPQGTIGTFSSGTAAGSILNLNTEQMVHTLGMAGSQSAGLMAAQEGSMVKRLHSGRACQSGVMAALLAKRGFTGITNVLEADYGGFCSTLRGDKIDVPALTAGLGKEWEILKVGFKQYASAASTHTALDAARSLMEEFKFGAGDCEKVVVHTTTMALVHCGFPYKPEGITSAQMNQGFTLATMLRYGEVFVDQFTEASIRDPETINFIRQRIQQVADPELDKLGPKVRHASWIEVFLRDGRRLMRRCDHRKGSFQNPMSRDEVRQKFRRLAVTVLPSERIDRLEEMVWNLESVEDVRSLADLMILQ
jgi:2-methylcitrate dehydratase PrpD